MIDKKKHTNTLWVEKYRPRTLDEYIGNEQFKNKIADGIVNNDIPQLLLYGKPGGGKTTAAKIIAENTDSEVLYVNASDENDVDNVRNRIKHFASTVTISEFKLIILDEADYLSLNAQAALRNIMEEFSSTTRFILTANYIEKMKDAIVSRCQTFNVVPPSKAQIARKIAKILDNESAEYNVEDIKILIDAGYPDIRKIINDAQKNVQNNKLNIDKSDIIASDVKLQLLKILKSGNSSEQIFKDIRQAVADNNITDFSEIYSFLYEKVDEYATGNISNVILAIAEGQRDDSMVVDKEIAFMATIVKILDVTN